MIYLLLKSINPTTRIRVSNLNDNNEKVAIYKFGNNLKDILDDMTSNCNIIIYEGVRHDEYVHRF